MRVKYIRNYGDADFFVVGQIYEVRQSRVATNLFDVLKDGEWSTGWCKTRFTIVEYDSEQTTPDIKRDAKQNTKPTPTNKEIAQYLVDKFFILGDNHDGKQTNRIQFMVGEYGVDEESSGGMARQPLERFFENKLNDLLGGK